MNLSPLLLAPAVTLAASLFPLLAGAAPRQPDGGSLEQAIAKLSVVGNALYVGAHPDDENTKLISYLANEKMLRTAYLSLTRGDGGQNLLGSEQGPLLGLIRTQELLAARGVDGGEQFFTRARDFGYSKTASESLAIWGKEEILADTVWTIRKFRPDVIITRFPPTGGDTHGHHTASAMLALEAFDKAADPTYHPEQLKYVTVWQAKRIVWNKGLFNAKPNEDLSGFIKLDIGAYNARLGVSYGEMAADSRSMHKSQGFGSARSRGQSFEYFQLLKGEPMKDGIFDGVDLTWARIKGAEKVPELIARARAEWRSDKPEASLAVLGQIRSILADPALRNAGTAVLLDQKVEELDSAMIACAGLYMEAVAADTSAVPGGEVAVSLSAINRSPAPVTLQSVTLAGETIPVNKELAANLPVQVDKKITIPANEALTNPYWLDQKPGAGLYGSPDARLIGMPEQPTAHAAIFALGLNGMTVKVSRPIVYKWTDPVAGERTRPLEIVAPVMINPAAPVLMFPDGKAQSLKVVLKSGKADVSGVLRLELPAGYSAEPAEHPFKLLAKSAEEEVAFQIKPPSTVTAQPGAAPPVLRAVAEVNGQKLDRGVARIEYPHIPIQTLFPLAEVKLVRFDLKKGGARLGYINGAGDEVAASLRQVGYEVTVLTDEMLTNAPLKIYDAIVVGVRAYNTNPRMPFHYKKLMDYVDGGGTLFVQYNTNNRLSKTPTEIGPFPFEISQGRVTDENAAVTLDANHAVLQKPNAIGAGDFQGWIQERGLYFAGTFDPRYQAPLSMADPGEPAQKGSLLVAHSGKGTFVYSGLAFFRQLPAGVPGAYRLFANLLAHGK